MLSDHAGFFAGTPFAIVLLSILAAATGLRVRAVVCIRPIATGCATHLARLTSTCGVGVVAAGGGRCWCRRHWLGCRRRPSPLRYSKSVRDGAIRLDEVVPKLGEILVEDVIGKSSHAFVPHFG